VEVINEDFFKWSGVQDSGEGSYVVALEVFVSSSTKSSILILTDRTIWPMT